MLNSKFNAKLSNKKQIKKERSFLINDYAIGAYI
jgi:hypothetical protein